MKKAHVLIFLACVSVWLCSCNKLNIGVEHLPSGLYFLRIHTSERVTIQKLIKK